MSALATPPDILVVEDEPELAALVADYLRAAGWHARVLHDGAAALADMRRAPPDLLVLDLMLPGLDGLAVCRAVREFSDLPVVMVTARVDEVDRLMGLDIGADDYVCKPFSPRELVARVRALLRRARPAARAPAPVEVDEAARRVRVRGQALDLTPTEFALLATMARRPGTAWSRAALLDHLRAESPDVLVLDLMLPGLDGLGVCRALREFSDLPVVMVTARVEEIDRLLGLEAGADDYLCKPFSPRELVARIKAILRRAGRPAPVVAVDTLARRIAVHGKALDLTPTEYGILAALARRPGQVFSRAQLLDLAREGNASLDVTDRAIDTHVKNLRRKLDVALPGVDAIRSIYGLGYRFDL